MKNKLEINENRGIPIDEDAYKAVETFFSVVKSVTAPLFPPVAILAQVASGVLAILFEKKTRIFWEPFQLELKT